MVIDFLIRESTKNSEGSNYTEKASWKGGHYSRSILTDSSYTYSLSHHRKRRKGRRTVDAEDSGEDDEDEDQPKTKKKKKVSTSHMFCDPSEPN
jgi:hypothetical protein